MSDHARIQLPAINDDEVERREIRRKSFAPDPAGTPAVPEAVNRRKSVGLGACSELSRAQVVEHYETCMQISQSDKITPENSFELDLINCMAKLLQCHDEKMENLTVAGCSLDAGTLIYSCRVDALYSQGVRMALGLDHAVPNGDGPQSQALKKFTKKSRKYKSALAKPESLKRKEQIFQPLDPLICHLSAKLSVSLSGECPFLNWLKFRERTDINTKSCEKLVPLPLIPDIKNLEICPSFRDFTFCGWVPGNDPRQASDLPPPPPPPPQQALDDVDDVISPTPIPTPDVDFGGGGCEGLDSDEFHETLSVERQEYSYFKHGLGLGDRKVKAGKPKQKGKDAAKTKKSNKKYELDFHGDEINCLRSAAGKTTFVKKTIDGWTTDRVTNPPDIHYDADRLTCLFLRESISVKACDDVEVDEGDYQYDNPTDQTSFCPNVPAAEGSDPNINNLGDGDGHAAMGSQQHEIGALIGDNLIAAPNQVAKNFIPYQTRPKEMDMKKLNQAVWSVLGHTSEADLEDGQRAEKSRMEEPSNFRTLYDALPDKLPQEMTQNLSGALAFVSLLHVASEKCLEITGVPDLSDLTISQAYK